MAAPAFAASDDLPADWPRVFIRDGTTNFVYQPQLESWDYVKLQATAAVAVQAQGAKQATFGTIQLTTKTRIDRAAGNEQCCKAERRPPMAVHDIDGVIADPSNQAQ